MCATRKQRRTFANEQLVDFHLVQQLSPDAVPDFGVRFKKSMSRWTGPQNISTIFISLINFTPGTPVCKMLASTTASRIYQSTSWKLRLSYSLLSIVIFRVVCAVNVGGFVVHAFNNKRDRTVFSENSILNLCGLTASCVWWWVCHSGCVSRFVKVHCCCCTRKLWSESGKHSSS